MVGKDENLQLNYLKKTVDGWMGGRMDVWSKSSFKDCLQRSKIAKNRKNTNERKKRKKNRKNNKRGRKMYRCITHSLKLRWADEEKNSKVACHSNDLPSSFYNATHFQNAF